MQASGENSTKSRRQEEKLSSVELSSSAKTMAEKLAAYLMVLGLALFLLFWYVTTEVLALPRFENFQDDRRVEGVAFQGS